MKNHNFQKVGYSLLILAILAIFTAAAFAAPPEFDDNRRTGFQDFQDFETVAIVYDLQDVQKVEIFKAKTAAAQATKQTAANSRAAATSRTAKASITNKMLLYRCSTNRPNNSKQSGLYFGTGSGGIARIRNSKNKI